MFHVTKKFRIILVRDVYLNEYKIQLVTNVGLFGGHSRKEERWGGGGGELKGINGWEGG